ncbi:hypothetical protein FKW77_001220 [Venturia effusa]|uniref:C3H1-type domain-containing protein n=1 Tax=Venturia effusa TaxID=50376 RepID=A0A517LI31_9PEZI|nr:hypothetical protein FKW77_001220 [Venturia effusa]
MLTDHDIDGLEEQLNAYKITNAAHNAALNTLTERYEHMIEDYRRLKSDYEEVREARERYKKLSKDQDKNPFVLVLVDGDGYNFTDQLIRSGGVDAAQQLHQQIEEYLPRLGTDIARCRIMVRMYANLQGLSKASARANLCGGEARALAPFTTGFTRARELFDFVDAGDKKEAADFKIRELFRLFIDNSQCKHIFFAGCHDNGYLSLLTPYINKMDRITLIKAAQLSPEFRSLGLRIVEFPSVFRTSPLDAMVYPKYNNNGPAPSTPYNRPNPQFIDNRDYGSVKIVCTHFNKPGKECRHGDKCRYLHIGPDGRDARDIQFNGSVSVNKKDTSTNGLMSPRLPDAVLPQPNGHLIPLNRDGHRVDVRLPRASGDDHLILKKRIQVGSKLCNDYQLAGTCRSDNCQYDHSVLAPELTNVLRHLAREIPCARKGGCRRDVCYKGHVCAKPGCRNCKLGYKAHGVDTNVAVWVEPEDRQDLDEAGSKASIEDVDGASPGSPTTRSPEDSSPYLSLEKVISEDA